MNCVLNIRSWLRGLLAGVVGGCANVRWILQECSTSEWLTFKGVKDVAHQLFVISLYHIDFTGFSFEHHPVTVGDDLIGPFFKIKNKLTYASWIISNFSPVSHLPSLRKCCFYIFTGVSGKQISEKYQSGFRSQNSRGCSFKSVQWY